MAGLLTPGFALSRCCAGVALVSLLACERPPVGGAPYVAEGSATVDLPSFLQDRPAIGGKWYDYSVDGHILQPKSELWIARLRDGEHCAFRIDSVYDDDTGNSGVFHFSVAHHRGGAWGDAVAVTAGGNVKDGDVCLALSDGATVPCDDDTWDLRLINQARLSVFAGFAVAEPAIVIHDAVVAARLDGASLSALPPPSTLAPLADDPDFATTDWRFEHLAPHLPAAGRVFGAADRLVGHTWWLASSSFHLGRLQFSVDGGALRVIAHTFAIDNSTQAVDADAVAAISDDSAVTVDVDLGALPVYIDLGGDGPVVVDAAVVGASLPGNTRRWDLAVVDDGGVPSVLLSPGAAALNGSALGKDPPFIAVDSP